MVKTGLNIEQIIGPSKGRLSEGIISMRFKRKLLSTSVALAVAGNVSPAFAEQAQTGKQQVVEEIVVTGIRGSLKRSMDVKREEIGRASCRERV